MLRILENSVPRSCGDTEAMKEKILSEILLQWSTHKNRDTKNKKEVEEDGEIIVSGNIFSLLRKTEIWEDRILFKLKMANP
jgi:hypothetical protein